MLKEKNILMIVGTNIERTKIREYKQAVSHDRDIKKLIRKGTFDVNWKPLIIIFGFFVFGLAINLYGLLSSISSFFSNLVSNHLG